MKLDFDHLKQIKNVLSFQELVDTKFSGKNNALCWQRPLEGDFEEIVNLLELKEDITVISEADLLHLNLSEQGLLAREIILNDIKLLREYGASPTINLLKCYERDEEFDYISTDVYSFHVDRSPIATDTFLCTYFGASSDIIANEEVTQKIQIPEVIEKLKALHDPQDGDFKSFLEDNFFDLHYQPNAEAKPINLEIGHLYRLAVDHPEQQVPPCVHRAPEENGRLRLLLIC
ncbi:MAG: DUF1826 domain-containing protein [Soonwooa sp.]